jgi:hypothetical protein
MHPPLSPKGTFPSPVKRDRGRGIETFGALIPPRMHPHHLSKSVPFLSTLD